jgi:hypothetical protein
MLAVERVEGVSVSNDLAIQLETLARDNGFRLKRQAKVVALLGPYVSDGSDVRAIFSSNDEKGYLVVTSRGVAKATPGSLSDGKIEFIP